MPNYTSLSELRKYLRNVSKGDESLDLTNLSNFVCLSIYEGADLQDIYKTFDKYAPKPSAGFKKQLMKTVLAEFDKQKRLKQSQLEASAQRQASCTEIDLSKAIPERMHKDRPINLQQEIEYANALQNRPPAHPILNPTHKD